MATMLIRVDGLESGDEVRLEDVLRPLPGVFGVLVSAREGCVEVDLEDDEIDFEQVVERVRDAGFDARVSG